MLASLYNGNVHVWNHESQQLVKSFEVCRMILAHCLQMNSEKSNMCSVDPVPYRYGKESANTEKKRKAQ
jgi:hypothetical protein